MAMMKRVVTSLLTLQQTYCRHHPVVYVLSDIRNVLVTTFAFHPTGFVMALQIAQMDLMNTIATERMRNAMYSPTMLYAKTMNIAVKEVGISRYDYNWRVFRIRQMPCFNPNLRWHTRLSSW